jgi:hypothetical protein
MKSAAAAKAELGAAYVPVSEFKADPPEINFVDRIRALVSSATKQISAKSAIDLGSAGGVDLVTCLATVFVNGLTATPAAVVKALSERIEKDALDQPGLMMLQVAVAQPTPPEKSSLRFAAAFVLSLLRQSQLSALIQYLGESSFADRKYFADAIVREFGTCARIAEEIERLECLELVDDVKLSQVPSFAPPVGTARFVRRITGAVDELVDKSRQWLLDRKELGKRQLPLYLGIVRLFMDAFLTLENGDLGGIDALWDLFEAFRVQKSPHNSFPVFLDILKSSESGTTFSTNRRRLVAALHSFLTRGILQFVILYAVGGAPVRQIANPVYSKDPSACLRISAAFLPLKELRFESNLRDFTAAFEKKFA